jgi:hypothetical protein
MIQKSSLPENLRSVSVVLTSGKRMFGLTNGEGNH